MAFATKPKLAQAMLERAVKAGLPFAWVAADEVYGQNPGLRDWLEQEHIGYVMAVPCSELITVAAGRRRADALARLVPGGAWQRLSCADGSKGPRLYDWALVDAAGSGHFLLVRRSLQLNEKGETELAYFCCYAPRGACGCRQSHPRHATRRYSLIVPPTRVCLRTRYWPRMTGCGSGFSGAAASSERCGRCWLWWVSY